MARPVMKVVRACLALLAWSPTYRCWDCNNLPFWSHCQAHMTPLSNYQTRVFLNQLFNCRYIKPLYLHLNQNKQLNMCYPYSVVGGISRVPFDVTGKKRVNVVVLYGGHLVLYAEGLFIPCPQLSI